MQKLFSCFLVISLCILTCLAQVDLPSSFCAREGFFRNPFDCTRFYRCVTVSGPGFRTIGIFNIYNFQCPQDTVFDEATQVCNHPWSSAPCLGEDNVASGSTPNPTYPHDPQGGVGEPMYPGGGETDNGVDYPPSGDRPSGITVVNPGDGIPPGVIMPPPGIGIPPISIPKPVEPVQGTGPAQVPPGSNPGDFFPSQEPSDSGSQQHGSGQDNNPDTTYPDEGFPFAPPSSGSQQQGSGQDNNPDPTYPDGFPFVPPASGSQQQGSGQDNNPDSTYPDGGFPFAPPGSLPDYGDDYEYPDYFPGDNEPTQVGAPGISPIGNPTGILPVKPPIPGIDDLDNTSDFGSGNDFGTPGQRPAGEDTSISFPRPPFGDNSDSHENQDSDLSSSGTERPPIDQSFGDDDRPSDDSKPGQEPDGGMDGPIGVFIPTDKPDIENGENTSKYEVYPGSLYDCPEPGFYPYEENCHEFYVCQEILPGKLLADQLYRCPRRYLFDEDTRRCQLEEQVSCRKFNVNSATSYSSRPNVLVVLERYMNQFFTTPLRYEETKRRFG